MYIMHVISIMSLPVCAMWHGDSIVDVGGSHSTHGSMVVVVGMQFCSAETLLVMDNAS